MTGPKAAANQISKLAKAFQEAAKYLASERVGGDNVVMSNLHFLKYDHGMKGDTVEAKVGAFS